MKLFYAPGVCSIGIHVLLEEIGKPYQLELVHLREGAQYKPPFTGVSPKGKVPALERDDGSVLTEFPVIARWLGRQANLLPKDDEADTRAMEAMEYVVGTMQARALHGSFARNASRRRLSTRMRSRPPVVRSSKRALPCSTKRWPARTTLPAVNSHRPTRRCSTANTGRQSGLT